MRALVLVGLGFGVGAGCASAEFQPDAGVEVPADARIDAAPDAATAAGFFLDDVAGDFAGGTATAVTIESWGAISPIAYYTGALRGRASDTGVFADAAAATWAQVAAMPFTAATAPVRALSAAWGAATPPGLALTAGDLLTLAYTGEVFLEAGTWTFFVAADDHAFLELAPPGSSNFTRVASANAPTEVTGTFVTATTGWHPVRIALAEQTGSALLRIEATGPGQAARGPLSRQRLRFAANDLTGLAIAGFDDARLLGDSAASIDRTTPAATDWATGFPPDLGLTAADDFSVRWTGQLRVDAGGLFTFRYLTDDGQRLWIDGRAVLDAWDETAHDAMTAPIELAPGWHDVVADVNEASGMARASLGVVAGPELVGAALPPARLRPIEARGERHEAGVDRADRPIPDVGQTESVITIDAPPGAKAAGVDVGWTFDHSYRGDLELTLVAPDGSQVLLRDNLGGGATGVVTERLRTSALDGATASGTWRLRARDTVSLDTGTLRDFQLTVHHRAGAATVPEHATYESRAIDLGPTVTAYSKLSWAARLPTGSAVRLLARSADTEADLRTATWSTPMVEPSGASPPITARRWFQYRVELDSDGDHAPIVDWVRLDLTAEVP